MRCSLIWSIFILVLLFLLKTNVLFAQNQKAITDIRVSPEILAKVRLPATTIIKQVDYIPLSNKSLNLRKVDQLVVTETNFIVLDDANSTRNGKSKSVIAIYDLKGQLTAKISGMETSSFFMDNKNELINFENFRTGELTTYNLKGELIIKKKITVPFSDCFLLASGKIVYYNGYYIDRETAEKKDTLVNNINYTDSTGKKIFGSLSFNPNNITRRDSGGMRKHFYTSNTAGYFIQEYDYNIYSVTENEILKKFRILLPIQLSLPTGFLSDPKMVNNRQFFWLTKKNITYGIKNVFTNGNYISFGLCSSGSPNNGYFYNTLSGDLFSLASISTDESTFSLPLGEEVMASSKDSFFNIISLSDINSLVGIKDVSTNFPDKIKQLITISKNENPKLIVKISLKQN